MVGQVYRGRASELLASIPGFYIAQHKSLRRPGNEARTFTLLFIEN